MTDVNRKDVDRNVRRVVLLFEWVRFIIFTPFLAQSLNCVLSFSLRHENGSMSRFFLTGKLCIEVEPTSKIAKISESLCIGCGICAKVRLHKIMVKSCI